MQFCLGDGSPSLKMFDSFDSLFWESSRFSCSQAHRHAGNVGSQQQTCLLLHFPSILSVFRTGRTVLLTLRNIRTCCEYGAKHIWVVCRKRNLTCPRVVSWFINQARMPGSCFCFVICFLSRKNHGITSANLSNLSWYNYLVPSQEAAMQ